MTRSTVFIADYCELNARCLEALLAPTYQVAGIATDAAGLMQNCERANPHLILLDLFMPLAEITDRFPHSRLIVLTDQTLPGFVYLAFRMGVSGYLLRNCPVSELFETLAAVEAGGIHCDRQLPAAVAEEAYRQANGGRSSHQRELTPREWDVLRAVVNGYSAKQAGKLMHISSKTVEFHKYRIIRKLRLSSSVELIHYALRVGLIPGTAVLCPPALAHRAGTGPN